MKSGHIMLHIALFPANIVFRVELVIGEDKEMGPLLVEYVFTNCA